MCAYRRERRERGGREGEREREREYNGCSVGGGSGCGQRSTLKKRFRAVLSVSMRWTG